MRERKERDSVCKFREPLFFFFVVSGVFVRLAKGAVLLAARWSVDGAMRCDAILDAMGLCRKASIRGNIAWTFFSTEEIYMHIERVYLKLEKNEAYAIRTQYNVAAIQG